MATQKISTKTERETHSAQVVRELQYHQVTRKLGCFRLTHSITLPDAAPTSLRAHFEASSTYGFATMREIAAFADDEAQTLTPDEELTAVSNEFLHNAAREGIAAAISLGGRYGAEGAWHAFAAGKLTAENVVHLKVAENLMLGLDNKPLPVALFFDYRKGGISDQHFDLEAAVRILSKDSRINPLKRGAYGELKNDEALRIGWIPEHQIIHGTREKGLTFSFSPTKDEMQQIWAKAREKYPKDPSRYLEQAVIDLDLLGLRAGDAVKKVSD